GLWTGGAGAVAERQALSRLAGGCGRPGDAGWRQPAAGAPDGAHGRGDRRGSCTGTMVVLDVADRAEIGRHRRIDPAAPARVAGEPARSRDPLGGPVRPRPPGPDERADLALELLEPPAHAVIVPGRDLGVEL